METMQSVLAAIGRFHPLVLHFPIGLIAAAAALELWSARRTDASLRPGISVLLTLASLGALFAAGSGLILGQGSDYDAALLAQHRVLGLTTAGLSVLMLLLHHRVRRTGSAGATTVYRLALVVLLLVVSGAAHFGGKITHGAESPFTTLALALRGAHPEPAPASTEMAGEPLLEQAALPLLESHCYECHGAEKQKHGLRLDQREAALTGGESGKPAIVPGNAMTSQLVEAITLPAEDKRAMPPSGKRRLDAREVLLLINWINQGARWPDTFQRHPEGLPLPSAATLEQLRAKGIRLDQLAQGHPLVRVDAVPKGTRLQALEPLAPNIAWLRLDGFAFEPGELKQLASMPQLNRLELQHSNVRDDDLVDVAKVARLTLLNLYATQVSDAGLRHLHDARSLERLYVWETQTTPTGIADLRTALPAAMIDSGGGRLDDPTATPVEGLAAQPANKQTPSR